MFPPEASFDNGKGTSAEFSLSETKEAPSNMLPHSREAEEAVIGAILINPDAYYEVRSVLRQGDVEFYLHKLRFIWIAFERLTKRFQPFDILTITVELQDMGRLDEIGGAAFITSLLNQVPSTLNVISYARIVHGSFLRRLLLTSANEIATLAYDTNVPIDEVLEKSIIATNPAILASTPENMVPIRQAVQEADEEVERNRRAGVLPGISTGFPDIDLKLGGGAQNGELILVAGRPGTGKTALLTQLVDNAARVEGKSVVVFSLEMTRTQLINRWIAQMAGIDLQLIRAGMIPEMKLTDYNNAIETISNLPVLIDDTARLTPSMMRAKLEVCANMGELDMVVLDYLSLLDPDKRYAKTSDQINDFARECKINARLFNIPFWALAQMNRSIESRDRDAEPQLSDLNEGGEKDPDIVGFLHHEKDEEDSILRSYLKFAKSRNGPTGKVFLRWRPAFTRWESYASTTISAEA